MIEDACACTCGKVGCISRPGKRVNRAGLTIHGLEGYKRGCRCDECSDAGLRKARERFARRNGDTRQKARNHSSRWTDAELKVAARGDLTDYEAGLLIGRTMRAVRAARQRYGIGKGED